MTTTPDFRVAAALAEIDSRWTAEDGHIPVVAFTHDGVNRVLLVSEDGWDLDEEEGSPGHVCAVLEDANGTHEDRESYFAHDGSLASILTACTDARTTLLAPTADEVAAALRENWTDPEEADSSILFGEVLDVSIDPNDQPMLDRLAKVHEAALGLIRS